MGTGKKGTGKKGTEKTAQEKWAQEKRAQEKRAQVKNYEKMVQKEKLFLFVNYFYYYLINI